MSTDLDQRLAATLRHRAGGEVDPAPIVEHARRRGRRLRLRRHGLITGGAVAACAVLAAAVMVIPANRAPDGVTMPATALALPDAPGQPGAITRPDAVGVDPGVIHFRTDSLVDGAEYATWSAGRGAESVEFRGPTGQARFVLARSVATLDALRQTLASSGRPQPPSDVRVGERPGVAWVDPSASGGTDLWFVRWQPADGLWAQLDIYATTPDEATVAASRVRFDGAHRCVVPFRLRSLPPAGRLLECSVRLGRESFVEGSLVVGDTSGRWLTVRAQRVPAGYDAGGGDLVAGPYRARRQGGDVLEMFVEPFAVEAFLEGWGKGYAESEGLMVLGGYQQARSLDQPETW
jgi:hypothetical protein